jgi:hypothetical protein
LLLVDPNSHDWDPTQTLTLNKAAWADVGPGEFGTSAPYYNDFRWQRQPSESLSLGRSFPIKEKTTFSVRIELQNVFNRMRVPIPGGFGPAAGNLINPDALTTYYPNGNLSGGYGFSNTFGGAGSSPRTGQIVARINF